VNATHAYTLRGPSTKECLKTTPGTRYPHRSVLDTALPVLNSVARHGLKLNKDGTPKGAYADINGDGKDEAVITYVCDQGGVAWPDNLLIYDNDLNYITQVEDWTRNGMEPARRHINQLEWTDDTVTVTWRAYGEGEWT